MKYIIANLKMNPDSVKKAEKYFKFLDKRIRTKNKVIVCVPFVFLNFKVKKFNLGAQDCFWEDKGPYTGEISPLMLKDLGVKYVIIGHSERRALGEAEEIIERKLRAALKVGLTPILCIGEKKGESAKEIIDKQLKPLKGLIIAYEPVWAISTSGGGFCSPEKAKEIMEYIRTKTDNLVIYGGSVDSSDIHSYLKVGFDGALVGGASLDPKEFIKIVENA